MSGIKDRLILASGSPQRFSLLVEAGFEPEVRIPEVDESIQTGESARSLVERVACLLYTSGAAADSLRVDLGGRRIV